MADYSIEVSIPNVGPQGPQGEVGPVGPANELSLGEITTGDAGTEAEATISGTPPNQVLDLVLPRGDTGAQGNPGPTGSGGIGVVPAPIYATMQEAVEDGITFGGVFRHTSGSVFWVEEPDPDAATFIAASGATDVWNLQQFVKGVKALGLWDDMVCWPLRSAQNAGTGTTAYSLGGLGTFNGTLVGGPAWTADGITFGGNTQYIEYSPQFTVDFTKGGYSVHAVWSALGVAVDASNIFDLFGSTGGQLQNVITTGVLGGTTWLLQSRNYNGNRYFQLSGVNQSITDNVGYGWNADTLTLQTNGADMAMSNFASSSPSNGLYTIRTTGRNNATAAATSRVSYLMVFAPDIGMTGTTMTALYNLGKTTLGLGLSLP
jgi:hypothetical protein